MPSGGYRPGAGRPRKNPIDMKLEGKLKVTPVKTVKQTPPPVKPTRLDLLDSYFSLAMKECGSEVPSAEALRAELETWISERGCAGQVPPQTISDYVLNRQGFLACELMNRKIGRMTKDLKLSPYVNAAQSYYKAMQADFNLIMQLINRHAGAQPEEQNTFLRLLMERGF